MRRIDPQLLIAMAAHDLVKPAIGKIARASGYSEATCRAWWYGDTSSRAVDAAIRKAIGAPEAGEDEAA